MSDSSGSETATGTSGWGTGWTGTTEAVGGRTSDSGGCSGGGRQGCPGTWTGVGETSDGGGGVVNVSAAEEGM